MEETKYLRTTILWYDTVVLERLKMKNHQGDESSVRVMNHQLQGDESSVRQGDESSYNKYNSNNNNNKQLTDKKIVGENNIEKLTDFFIAIKGIKGRKNRYFRPAGELLTLCNYNLAKAKKKVNIIKSWAEREGIEWDLNTVVKRYLDVKK